MSLISQMAQNPYNLVGEEVWFEPDTLNRVFVVKGKKGVLQSLRGVLKTAGRARFLPKIGWHIPADLDTAFELTEALRGYGVRANLMHGCRELGSGFFDYDNQLLSLTHKTKPYEFQRLGTQWLATNAGCMLLDEMGLGKTKQAIDAAMTLCLPMVIVCPNTVKRNWEEELEKHGRFIVDVPTGTTKQRGGQILSWESMALPNRAIILNYEALRYFPDEFWWACKGTILILDEAHRVKNGQAKVSKIIKAARPERIWLLTGTPVANRPEDVWHLVHLVRPGLLGWNWSTFEKNHIERDYWGGIKGYRDLETVRNQLAKVSMGRKKVDVVDLPEKVFESRVIELNVDEKRAYKTMTKDLVAWVESEVPEAGPTVAQAKTLSSRFIRLRQIADGFISEGAEGRQAFVKTPSKITEAIQVWEDAGRPRAVFWCQYLPVIDELCRRLGAISSPKSMVRRIDGRVEEQKRRDSIGSWKVTDRACLVVQMDTGGEGINLQASSFQVFVDVPMTPRQRMQCVDRLHRIGQGETVTVVDILAGGTVDMGLHSKLKGKIELADHVTRPAFQKETRDELLEMIQGGG